MFFHLSFYQLDQGSPTLRPQTGTSACQELGYTAGERWVNKQSFTCIYGYFPLLTLLPELHFPSDQRQHQILIGARILLHLNHPETIPPAPVCGKNVFHRTKPWCQKVGGSLYWIINIHSEFGTHVGDKAAIEKKKSSPFMQCTFQWVQSG